ncbi:neuroendocrine convertase 1-like [Centruroides vittatus]|uniref:neuroendocrine convertase 1-like n=1 Tax=Centruroides vittatus TaxID=120091 RepID=UPI00350E8EDB
MIFVTLLLLTLITYVKLHDNNGHFTNDWVVRITGGNYVADELARELGYRNLGELKGFKDTYMMRRIDHPQRSRRNSAVLTKRLSDDRRVIWAEQQVVKPRVKRGVIRTKRANHGFLYKDNCSNKFKDPFWSHQWYLCDTRDRQDLPRIDFNPSSVWDGLNITGRGIVLTVMDDGLEWNHTDILPNYDPEASWDSNDNDPDPFPRYDEYDSNNHGTRCAGEIAMVANNDKCGVGVAYNAKIGGIRMLDGDVSDAVESISIAFRIDHIDIFSASWGPSDDGMTVDGPKRLAIEALEKGIFEGRNGKGVIYVWASGNGGSKGDNCNCDGYTSSIYTLSIGSASQHGRFPWYGEKCASTMASTFSSGAYTDQKISSTDLHNQCTDDHTGTSAAAPLAAGMIALVLEANGNLTWRDVQHIVVWTSDVEPLKDNNGWKRNAVGLMYNSRFGFGLMDAESMVKTALKWKSVPPKYITTAQSKTEFPQPLSSGREAEIYFETDCGKNTENQVRYLEHVQVTVDVDYNRRGALELYLISPSGSRTMLLSKREKDKSAIGFKNWTFLTVHLWGEKCAGQYKLLIRDKIGEDNRGEVKKAILTLHGTKDMPEHMKGGKIYSKDSDVESIIDKSEFEDDVEDDTNDLSDKLSEIRESNEGNLDWDQLIGERLRSLDQKNSDRFLSDFEKERNFDYVQEYY